MSDYTGTPIMFDRGNIVRMTERAPWSAGSAGVVLYVDHNNAADGGEMNYKVAVIEGGAVTHKLWFSNDQLELIDDGKYELGTNSDHSW